MGNCTIKQEVELVAEAKQWIEERADTCEAYATYLDSWTDWVNPWDATELVS
jgi:hypothetical protein